MDSHLNLLIVDDEPLVVAALERQLRRKYRICKAESAQEGLNLLHEEPINVILSDERMPGMSGLDFLEQSRQIRPDAIRIIVSGYEDPGVLKKAINSGVVHGFVNKPVNVEELDKLIERQIPDGNLFPEIIGKSEKIQEVFSLIAKAAKTNSTILVTGESGTGKELVARALYRTGVRRGKPFVVENCAAITPTLLEAELFGHIKGSFTGATYDKQGLFEVANTGILVLDEIGDITKDMQTKLLRVIENGSFRKVGGTKNTEVDVQLVFCTNKNLYNEVQLGNFRGDLYYRINVINIHLPPLRERKVDIPLVANHYAKHYAKKLGKSISIDNGAMEMLLDYDWPGNVRELEHEMERAVAITDTDRISEKNLTIKRNGRAAALTVSAPALVPEDLVAGADGSLDFYAMVEDYEKKILTYALEQSKGSKRKASMILNMTRQSLCNKVAKYGLDQRFPGDDT